MTSSNANSTITPKIAGHVDAFTDAAVTGWACDAANLSRRCAIKLVSEGRTLARAAAADFRADLKEAGIGDGAHGFSLMMPRSLLDGREHTLQVVEEESGALIGEPRKWRSSVGGSGAGLLSPLPSGGSPEMSAPGAPGAKAAVRPTILIDLSDLVYYIGNHDNLTGIQRVQSSIVLAMVRGDALAHASVAFITYYAVKRTWMVVPFTFFVNLLEDLFYPKALRRVAFSAQEARAGMLPGAVELERSGALNPSAPSALCLLGAAWVQQDYFNRVLALKRKYGTRFVMLVHDLIPIYARETCDQGTAQVFERFFTRALRHVDHYLCVSENTARDLRGYLNGARAAVPPITVTRLGASFTTFLNPSAGAEALAGAPERFVLFVSTIEGRKNHKLMFDVWRRLLERGEDPPVLLCVGRLGWRAEGFLSGLVETAYLDGRIVLMEDVSDEQLQTLYQTCLFTVFPSLYEGWGLPVGESLAAGRICVCSTRASIPEVAGDFGVFIDIDDLEACVDTIGRLAKDGAKRREIEERIARDYKPDAWDAVAAKVVRTCADAAAMKWPEPYPFTALPYSCEVGFSTAAASLDGVFGEKLLAAINEPRRPHILFEPLGEASLLLGEDMRAAGAWGQPETWGAWMCETGGEIVVALGPNESRYYYVFLRLRAARSVEEARVRLSVNAELLWEGALGATSRTIVMRAVRKSSDKASGWRLRIRAEVDVTDELRMRIAAHDSRIPTVGFERLAVIPETDVNARLEATARLQS